MFIPKCIICIYASLANSSSIDAVDKFNRTPLIYCVLGDRLDCAELLIREGAEVNHKDAGGRTPLHLAAHKVCNNWPCSTFSSVPSIARYHDLKCYRNSFISLVNDIFYYNV